MDFEQLKQIEKRIQIISIIEKAQDFGGDIWQTGRKGRDVFRIVQIQIDLSQDKIIFRTNGIGLVSQEFPIFVRLSYRNVIFRLDPHEFKVTGDKLVCHYPQEARALEIRRGDRYVLPFEQNISLSLKRTGRSLRDLTPEIEVRIIDVSEQGFGILISGANRDFLRPYDNFWIKGIDNRPLEIDIFGTVLYVAPKGYYLKKQDVRVGLSLSTPLSWHTFEYLKRKCLVVLSA